MWHKPCRTFHPWCLCIKTRCLYWNLGENKLQFPSYLTYDGKLVSEMGPCSRKYGCKSKYNIASCRILYSILLHIIYDKADVLLWHRMSAMQSQIKQQLDRLFDSLFRLITTKILNITVFLWRELCKWPVIQRAFPCHDIGIPSEGEVIESHHKLFLLGFLK